MQYLQSSFTKAMVLGVDISQQLLSSAQQLQKTRKINLSGYWGSLFQMPCGKMQKICLCVVILHVYH